MAKTPIGHVIKVSSFNIEYDILRILLRCLLQCLVRVLRSNRQKLSKGANATFDAATKIMVKIRYIDCC